MRKFITNEDSWDGYQCPDAPPLSAKEEAVLQAGLKIAKDKVYDKQGELIQDENFADNYRRFCEIRDDFIEAFSYIPYKYACRFRSQCHNGLGVDDLAQTGFMALSKAVDRNDFRTTSRWSTFADKVVKKAIFRFLDDNSRTIRVPSEKTEALFVRVDKKDCVPGSKGHDKVMYRRLRGLAVALECQIMDFCGHTFASIATTKNASKEVAEAIGLDVATINSVIKQPVSISSGDDEASIINDLIYSEQICDETRRDIIEKALSYINPNAAQVIRRTFFESASLNEIAEQNDYTRMRAKAMLRKGVKQLQEIPEARDLLEGVLDGRD